MNRYQYDLKRSCRRTISVEVTKKASLIVRAPLKMSKGDIERFLDSKSSWIDSNMEKVKKLAPISEEKFTYEELERLRSRAREVIIPRVEYFAPLLGVEYNRITVKTQKTRFGSCSSKKNLNFNALIVLMPEPIVDYVIVHELAHLREMNHSQNFWCVVESLIPDYRACREYLKEEGRRLIGRL